MLLQQESFTRLHDARNAASKPVRVKLLDYRICINSIKNTHADLRTLTAVHENVLV